ncbi:putative uncharacterized protein C3orf56 homolog [Perognathus longimembris pacificus]|uniref:putative uncharacterized protein C3orf56 homolog n=1 Tax=Perognathus longimembris pacificus TaxID=214514 RepID=UPI00201893CD|nr:putative uncharacterized protein C3orf56 homolog [Perognathus longimembris pacificus]
MSSSTSQDTMEEQVPRPSASPVRQPFNEASLSPVASYPCVPHAFDADLCTCWSPHDSILWPSASTYCEVHACPADWPWDPYLWMGEPHVFSSRDLDSFGAFMGRPLSLETYNSFPEPSASDLSVSRTREYRLFPEPSAPNPFALPTQAEVVSSDWAQGSFQPSASWAPRPAGEGLHPQPPFRPTFVTEWASNFSIWPPWPSSSPELHPLPPTPFPDPQPQAPRKNFPHRPPSKARRCLVFDN